MWGQTTHDHSVNLELLLLNVVRKGCILVVIYPKRSPNSIQLDTSLPTNRLAHVIFRRSRNSSSKPDLQNPRFLRAPHPRQTKHLNRTHAARLAFTAVSRALKTSNTAVIYYIIGFVPHNCPVCGNKVLDINTVDKSWN